MNRRLKYAVCIDAVYMHQKCSFYDAMKQVKSLGYDAVEFWSWWDKDTAAIRRGMEDTGLSVAAFCTRFVNPGDGAARETYLDELRKSCAVAGKLSCRTIIVQAGWEFESFPKGITRAQHREALIETMQRAGEEAEQEGITLVIEPLNLLVDHPGYHLSTSADALDLLERIDRKNVQLLFDIYHQQITEGNLIRNITRGLERGQIGHFHAAGNPGRGPVTEGEIHYPHVLSAIADAGYAGYVGLEYMTGEAPEHSLRLASETVLV